MIMGALINFILQTIFQAENIDSELRSNKYIIAILEDMHSNYFSAPFRQLFKKAPKLAKPQRRPDYAGVTCWD